MRKLALLLSLLMMTVVSCSSGGKVKRQEYAELQNTKVFEEEFPVVWKAIGEALSEYKIEKKNSEDGYAKTDWIYSTSNDKYVEYQVNGFPRKHYLQTRYRFEVETQKQLGGVKVTVNQKEEVEKLKSDGSFDGWKSADVDTQRSNELLKNIELKILSRAQ